jgi:hypothetical protein
MASANQQTFSVFVSFRFCEAETEAKALKVALGQRNISAFVCDIPPGGNIEEAIVTALSKCKLVVILGTETYGEKGTTHFSTYNELLYVLQYLPDNYFLVKMCTEFKHPMTKFRLSSSVSWFDWTDGTVDKITELKPHLHRKLCLSLLPKVT